MQRLKKSSWDQVGDTNACTGSDPRHSANLQSCLQHLAKAGCLGKKITVSEAYKAFSPPSAVPLHQLYLRTFWVRCVCVFSNTKIFFLWACPASQTSFCFKSTSFITASSFLLEEARSTWLPFSLSISLLIIKSSVLSSKWESNFHL